MPAFISDILKNTIALGLEVYEVREQRTEYCEMVVYAKDLLRWEGAFSCFLGPPTKPQGTRVTAEIQKMTRPYGGIEKNQTLYVSEKQGHTILLMLWPWQDRERITVKIMVTG